VRCVRVGETGLSGLDDGLCPVAEVELVQDVGHVVGDRLGRQEECFSDLSVVVPIGDEAEHLSLAIGESREWDRLAAAASNDASILSAAPGPNVTCPPATDRIVPIRPTVTVAAATGQVSGDFERHGGLWRCFSSLDVALMALPGD